MTSVTTFNYTNFCLYFIAIGIIVVLFTTIFGSVNQNTLVGTMLGYSIIISGFILLASLLTSRVYNGSLITVLYTIGPFLLIIATLIYLVYILGVYFNKISSGNISTSYYNFTNIFLILTLIQIAIFYNGVTDNKYQSTMTLSKVTNMLLYLVGIINIIVVITLMTILAFFSTDG